MWMGECEIAFETIKRVLCSKPVLVAPDFHCPFKVQTDASVVGLGAVLSQGEYPDEHPVLHLSWKLNPAERAYAVIEREVLAIKWSLHTLRYYLLGAPFTLVTDRAPLTWLHKMKDTNPRLTWWYMALQPYVFTIWYRKGKEHANADFFS